MTARTVKVVRRQRNLAAGNFIARIIRTVLATIRHLWLNRFWRRDKVVLNYPEETRPYAPRWRGLHRLMHRTDGSIRCVACMLCSTHCPANCIKIEAAEHPDINREKVPVSFDIDLLKCISCGLCEEACPSDAIRVDTGLHARPMAARMDAMATIDQMLARGGQSTARQGDSDP